MNTTIEWTDATWNPVTGCTRISPGCDNCYMFAMYPRLKAMGLQGYQEAPDRVTLLPERLQQPLTWRKPRMVFVNSMSDLFHYDVPYEFISEVFRVMDQAKHHTFQVLTKRPGRAVAWWREYGRYISWVADGRGRWPQNVWMGTSVETQKYAPRLTVLGRIPAPVRFVSVEPMLERMNLRRWLDNGTVQWVIVGGESGRRARPMDLDWIRDLLVQCQLRDIPFFLKQLGGRRGKRGGADAILDGVMWQKMPQRGKNDVQSSGGLYGFSDSAEEGRLF